MMVRMGVLAWVMFASACKSRSTERDGNFSIRTVTEDAVGHRSSRTSLVYKGRTLNQALTDWTVDPRNPDRIVYASRIPCGTYLFNGKTGDSFVLAARDVIVHAATTDTPDFAGSTPWSPDGQYFWMGNDIAAPIVVDLHSFQQVALTDALSSAGRRLEMTAVMWSPDSRRIAAVVQPGGYNDPDRDLAAITLSPLSGEYVATMTDVAPHGLLLWTTGDFRWDDGKLVVGTSGRRGPTVVRSPDRIRWAPLPPTRPNVGMGNQCS